MQRFLIGLMTLLWTIQSTSAQSVIINEMSQGSDGGKEWVELLIVDEGVDLRGWELGDNDDGVWHPIAEFSTHSELNTIARGTIIVIYNSGDVDESIAAAGGEDTTFSDKSVLLGVNNTSFLVDTGPWGATAGAFANSDGDDAPAIRDASDEIIHDMAVTHPTATVSTPGSAKVKYYTSNTVGSVVDDSQWTVANSSSATPGQANGGANSNWVDQSLPVELSRWFASSLHGEVMLNWTTDSENENQGFIIERTLRQAQGPSSVWKEIATFVTNPKLQGQGSTSAQHDYAVIDKQVKVGETYSYRLSDVDYRGQKTQHDEILVTVKNAGVDPKPAHIKLHKAFPNPFNPDVNLSFTLETTVENLSLEIYDIQGILINTVSSGSYEMGTHDYRWNGNDGSGNAVSSGVYMVRLSTGSVVQIQRVTLLR
ncbi:MAG: T9SS type A sorting domain-containing protein [FCB group bacterium]|nr:T9SS type A sorting domain-containing protein [FCB group bacterium]MBL7029514.1 T9SS type A sorting domain-containing protein [Candidatus Neomarinimicrobiota bacterium]MBL7122947.1 T9SS type A sorting domain-containing protein [Candidatus Neomarinimicrobiota bacterium]